MAQSGSPRPPGRHRRSDDAPLLGGATVVEILPPGSFVRLRNQPEDLPPFQLLQCQGGRCWVRQQAWGRLVHWEVARRNLTRASA